MRPESFKDLLKNFLLEGASPTQTPPQRTMNQRTDGAAGKAPAARRNSWRNEQETIEQSFISRIEREIAVHQQKGRNLFQLGAAVVNQNWNNMRSLIASALAAQRDRKIDFVFAPRRPKRGVRKYRHIHIACLQTLLNSIRNQFARANRAVVEKTIQFVRAQISVQTPRKINVGPRMRDKKFGWHWIHHSLTIRKSETTIRVAATPCGRPFYPSSLKNSPRKIFFVSPVTFARSSTRQPHTHKIFSSSARIGMRSRMCREIFSSIINSCSDL